MSKIAAWNAGEAVYVLNWEYYRGHVEMQPGPCVNGHERLLARHHFRQLCTTYWRYYCYYWYCYQVDGEDGEDGEMKVLVDGAQTVAMLTMT